MLDTIKKYFGFVTKKRQNEDNRTFVILLIFSVFSLFASFMLTIDYIAILQNPGTKLNCSINVILNCSTVMQTWQSSLFGFPNTIVGLIAYSVLVTIAVIALTGVRLSKTFMVLANLGALGGIIFSEWLAYESIYVIQVLCPYCLIVLFSTIMIFAAITHYNLRNNNFNFKIKTNNKIQNFLDKEYDKLLVFVWVSILVFSILSKFGMDLFA